MTEAAPLALGLLLLAGFVLIQHRELRDLEKRLDARLRNHALRLDVHDDLLGRRYGGRPLDPAERGRRGPPAEPPTP